MWTIHMQYWGQLKIDGQLWQADFWLPGKTDLESYNLEIWLDLKSQSLHTNVARFR